MEFSLCPRKRSVDPVPADPRILHVQRLVDIPREMYDHLQRLVPVIPAESLISYPLSVVGQRADDAALLRAIPLVDHFAASWRCVQRVDEMKHGGEGAFGR